MATGIIPTPANFHHVLPLPYILADIANGGPVITVKLNSRAETKGIGAKIIHHLTAILKPFRTLLFTARAAGLLMTWTSDSTTIRHGENIIDEPMKMNSTIFMKLRNKHI